MNFGDLDYEADDLVNVELTMRYDWADKTARSNQVNLSRSGLTPPTVLVEMQELFKAILYCVIISLSLIKSEII